MDRNKLYIYGTGTSAEVVSRIVQDHLDYSIVAYVIDKEFLESRSFCGKPVITFEESLNEVDKKESAFFVTLGYSGMNRRRREVCDKLKKQGFHLASIIHPSANVPSDFSCGENCFIMNDVHVHPCVKIGDNNFIWSGTILCHHVTIKNDCWFTSGTMVAGSTSIGSNCFFGIGASVTNDLAIGDGCFVGAGALVSKNLPDGAVVVRPSDAIHPFNSFQFTNFLNNRF